MDEFSMIMAFAVVGTAAAVVIAVTTGRASLRVRVAREESARWQAIASGLARRLGEAGKARRDAEAQLAARIADDAAAVQLPTPFFAPAQRTEIGADAR